MYELFYIIETQEGWYQLCVKGTHYVLSSGSDLDKILMTLKNLLLSLHGFQVSVLFVYCVSISRLWNFGQEKI